jgi:hypothetical protein
MKYNFVIRIHKDINRNPSLSDIQDITISDITIVSKSSKFTTCLHINNQTKFKYTFKLSKLFNKISGSNNYPNLSFKGEYIDISVKDFPRYPVFYQDKIAARNIMNGYSYNHPDNGFPMYLQYRNIEILNIQINET